MMQHNLSPNSPFFHEERHTSLTAIIDTPITVCGAGALGGNLVETLARMGFSCLKVIDRDKIEMRNLSTQPYSRAEVGFPNARALANLLYCAVQAKLEPIVAELTTSNAATLLQGSVLVIDAFDNRAARGGVSATVLAQHIPCLHIGFSADGLYGSGLWEPEYQLPHDVSNDPCDYPLTRPFALTIVALAAQTIIDFLRTGQSTNFELTWKDRRISNYALASPL